MDQPPPLVVAGQVAVEGRVARVVAKVAIYSEAALASSPTSSSDPSAPNPLPPSRPIPTPTPTPEPSSSSEPRIPRSNLFEVDGRFYDLRGREVSPTTGDLIPPPQPPSLSPSPSPEPARPRDVPPTYNGVPIPPRGPKASRGVAFLPAEYFPSDVLDADSERAAAELQALEKALEERERELRMLDRLGLGPASCSKPPQGMTTSRPKSTNAASPGVPSAPRWSPNVNPAAAAGKVKAAVAPGTVGGRTAALRQRARSSGESLSGSPSATEQRNVARGPGQGADLTESPSASPAAKEASRAKAWDSLG